ncbi:MAG: Tol biopolymer transport system component [Marinoscillum sp.]|jgi:Tol biopolymer transport system component
MRGFILTLILVIFTTVSAVAQYYHTPFGHNRIQYKNFEWYYYTTNNFEVYYYPGGHEYAQQALQFLEKEFTEITDILGYAPYTKTKIFIYNSMQELQQSNIGIGGDVFTIGGKTDFVKLQVELAYPDNSFLFKKEIIHQLSFILINDMMFGGSLAEIFQNSYLLSLPRWFIGGASRYLAYEWSQDMDDYVRDYLSRKKINKLVRIQDEDADIIGQSIWNYIAVRYGPSSISNILNLTRIIRNEENSISSTLGITFKDFLSDWQNYYLQQSKEINENYREAKDDDIIAGYKSREVTLSNVKMSADGERVAYSYHKNGKYEVRVVDLNTGRESVVVRGGYLINDQQVNFHLPLTDWQDNQTLGVVLYKRGALFLNTYNLETGERFQKELTQFRQVASFCFNDNGKLAVISGDVDGQNDLFLISMRRNALKRITNDLYDDIDPIFVPGTAALVFASNRESDSLKVGNVDFKTISDNYNLFVYDLDTTTQKFLRVTNTYSVDRKPIAKNQHEIYYLSDQKGITNLYKYDLYDSTFVQVSNFQYSITDYDVSFTNPNRLTFLMLDKGRQKVFTEDNFDFDNKIFTPQTGRQRVKQAKFMSRRISLYEPKKPVIVPEPITLEPDSSILSVDAFSFLDEEPAATPKTDDGFIDTDNYVFEEEVRTEYRPESFFSNYRKYERESRVIGPNPYSPRFSFNNLITSFGIDPIRGFSILLETEINDLLENHRLNGGVNTSQDFRSGKIYGEYQFLKYWMDFRLRFERNTYIIDPNTSFLMNNPEEDLIQRYTLNKIELGMSLPLTNTFRFELSPFYAGTQFTNLQWEAVINANTGTNLAPSNNVHYGGLRGAMVLDNTLEQGFNIYQGTKALIEFESFASISDNNKSFSRLNVDLRHYQKIHRELTLAGRVFYGKSFGSNSQKYLLGGMDNWALLRRYEDQGAEDPLRMSNSIDNSNILFTRFVTNLRGFDYNQIYGTNVLLFNAELRLPFFRYLSDAPLSSTLLRNFQVIGFYDVGTAWTGKAPFTADGTAFTKKYVTQGPFSAEIATFQNPWLASYGVGFRTVLFGYYLKLDIANPIQDFKIGNSRYHLTLGLDF